MQKFLLFLILFLSFILNYWNHDFNPDYHADEPKKALFIQKGTQDFLHPILMLQSVRNINYFVGYSERDDIVHLGRLVSALAITATVGLVYLIARRQKSPSWSLLAALSTALSPILVIHAHYFKEDALFTCFTTLSLLLFLKYADKHSFKRALVLGLGLGLALSSKYLGIYLIPFFFLISLRYRLPIGKFFISTLTAFCIFCLVNYPLFIHFDIFQLGLSKELNHAQNGHTFITPLPITPYDSYFSFHLIHSLMPGMTFILAILGMGSAFYVIYKSPSRDEKVIGIISIAFYLLIESSSLKAFPDFMRYAMPMVPLLIILAVSTAQKNTFASLFFTLGIAYSAWDTISLVYYLKEDTRDLAKQWIAENQGVAFGEKYTGLDRGNGQVPLPLYKKEEGITHLIASSFTYDRIFYARSLNDHDPFVDKACESYEVLFERPHIEIKPKHRSFAFSNPTIKIFPVE